MTSMLIEGDFHFKETLSALSGDRHVNTLKQNQEYNLVLTYMNFKVIVCNHSKDSIFGTTIKGSYF